jgi:hypothetical protein
MYVQEFGFWFYSDQCKCRVLDVTASVFDTGGKFAADVNNTGCQCAAVIASTAGAT